MSGRGVWRHPPTRRSIGGDRSKKETTLINASRRHVASERIVDRQIMQLELRNARLRALALSQPTERGAHRRPTAPQINGKAA
jgi:hypothetical protein